LSSGAYTVGERAGTATITVLLSGASGRTVSISYATAGGTATPGSDYGIAGGTLTFEPGVTSRTFAVSVVDDAADEADEMVGLVLSNPVNAVLGARSQAVLTIVDDDEPPPLPQVEFSAATYSVDEGAGTATITVLLSGAFERTVGVGYATAGGTATPSSDYGVAGGTLTFEPGVTSRTFAVSVADDADDEVDETVGLALSSPVNAVLGARSEAALVIVDDDEPSPVPSNVRLNEILSTPGETDWDGNGVVDELDEWIELYNVGPGPADLGGWLLDGTKDGSAPYRIPDGTVLEPRAFLVLHRQGTGIALEDSGDTLHFLEPSGQVWDAVTFGEIGADASYNRSESGGWAISTLPSPGAPNALPAQ
jgi:hypothetical protein